MYFDRKYLVVISILGVLLLLSYYYFFKTDNNSMKFWGRIKGNLLTVYYISMLLATIGFLFLFYYIIISSAFNKSDIYKLFISIISIVLFSFLWMPASLEYLKSNDKNYRYIVLAVLFMVVLSTVMTFFYLNSVEETKNIISKRLALAGVSYFFIHVFFFDFILWSYNFF